MTVTIIENGTATEVEVEHLDPPDDGTVDAEPQAPRRRIRRAVAVFVLAATVETAVGAVAYSHFHDTHHSDATGTVTQVGSVEDGR